MRIEFSQPSPGTTQVAVFHPKTLAWVSAPIATSVMLKAGPRLLEHLLSGPEAFMQLHPDRRDDFIISLGR